MLVGGLGRHRKAQLRSGSFEFQAQGIVGDWKRCSWAPVAQELAHAMTMLYLDFVMSSCGQLGLSC